MSIDLSDDGSILVGGFVRIWGNEASGIKVYKYDNSKKKYIEIHSKIDDYDNIKGYDVGITGDGTILIVGIPGYDLDKGDGQIVEDVGAYKTYKLQQATPYDKSKTDDKSKTNDEGDDDDEESNVALIAGLSAGGGVLLIIVSVYLIMRYRRKKATLSSQSTVTNFKIGNLIF